MAWNAIYGKASAPLRELGWKPLGVLELTVMPHIEDAAWVPTVRDADAILVWGTTRSRDHRAAGGARPRPRPGR